MIKKTSVILLSALLLLFMANRLFFFRPTFLDKGISCISYPFMQVSSKIAAPIKNVFYKYRSIKKLNKHIKKLEKEREELLSENISLKTTTEYDEKSKDIRNFQERYKLENTILARVLLKALTNEEQTIIVNCGSRDGVTLNMAAIYKFQLLGRVSRVYPWYSKITLITDRHSKVSAHTNKSNAAGIVEGNNNTNTCHMRHVSHLAKVHNGDFVFSSGQGMVFPEGFCLGKIVNLKTEDICHYVEIEPLVDIKHLEMCHLTNQEKMNLF